jgi:hypothetical protein
MIDSKKSLLDKIQDNDPFNLLVQKPKASTHRDIPQMLKDAFDEINDFYEKNGHEPSRKDNRTLCAKLEGIREDANQIALLSTNSKETPINFVSLKGKTSFQREKSL